MHSYFYIDVVSDELGRSAHSDFGVGEFVNRIKRVRRLSGGDEFVRLWLSSTNIIIL